MVLKWIMDYSGSVKWTGILCVVAALAVIPAHAEEELDGSPSTAPASTAESNTRPNPYQAIVDRNPFGLHPPAPPPEPPPKIKQEPPPNLSFTGITGDAHHKKAWLVANLPGKNPPIQYYSLEENEKQDDIEVLEIDSKGEAVKIRLRGDPLTLTFKDNAKNMKAITHAAGIAQPPVPGQPVPGAMPPGAQRPAAGPIIIGKNGQVMGGGGNPSAPSLPGAGVTPNGMTDVTGRFGGNNNSAIPQRTLRTSPQDAGASLDYAANQLIRAAADKVVMEHQTGKPGPPLPELPGAGSGGPPLPGR